MSDPSPDAGISPGIAAARAGQIEALTGWLAAGNDPNRYDPAGWTPLLWASARGHAAAVKLLIEHGADPGMAHRESGALPIHLAGQSGDVETARALLDRRPDLLDAVLDVNGHTLLLQAAFYGHLDLARFALEQGADTAITTARGLGALELAAQFQNQPMVDLIRPFDKPASAKADYYRSYLARVAPHPAPSEAAQQALADELVRTIEDGLGRAANDSSAVDSTLAAVKDLVETRGADVNRLGGPLQQPALIVVATGNNGFPPNPNLAKLRNDLARYLLEHGADPTLRELHPMAVQTVIRAAVFNHLEILRMCAAHITSSQMADAINEVPLVNGLTAMHDTVLRGTMAAPEQFEGYLDQVRFLVGHGGRVDMEDYSGVTQRAIAERARDETTRQRLLDALDGRDPTPA
jgi:ankyrin repeat protein